MTEREREEETLRLTIVLDSVGWAYKSSNDPECYRNYR